LDVNRKNHCLTSQAEKATAAINAERVARLSIKTANAASPFSNNSAHAPAAAAAANKFRFG
jgi:hypothetical protein